MPDRPNFLIFMTEQHRGDCLGVEGHPCLLTPNMDSIALQGARFSRAYSTCPTCIPARRSLLSGQFPSTHGMVGYQDGVEWDAPPTLPGVLSDAGYQTEWIGRSIHQHPARKRYGFQHMITNVDYFDWLRTEHPTEAGGHFGTGVMHNDWTARPWHMDESLHFTNWAVNRGLEFLEKRDPSCPFFTVVSFCAAHPPLTPPAFYMDRYLRQDLPDPVIGEWETPPPEERWRAAGASSDEVNLTGEALKSCRAGYYGLINHMDDQIRRILNPVNGVDRMTNNNTVVMLLSDHGEMLGDHYMFRKKVPYEPSARVPLLIRAPARFGIKPYTVCDEAVCLEDVMPTILDLAGVDIPETVDGRSLMPMLRGEDVAWREHLHIEHASMHHTLTDGRDKYIWFVEDGREQLFDLVSDPNERRDLAPDPAHADRLARWRTAMIAELRDRPEGFSDGEKLIAGRPYAALLPGGPNLV